MEYYVKPFSVALFQQPVCYDPSFEAILLAISRLAGHAGRKGPSPVRSISTTNMASTALLAGILSSAVEMEGL